MLGQHSRTKIWTQFQHPFAHDLSQFAYQNDALPAFSDGTPRQSVSDALNYIFSILYPRTKESVADPASLPLVGNDINDFRIVQDDGDGKYAGYTWLQLEGDLSPKWYKTHDPDFGADDVLSQLLDKSQQFYLFKYGFNDMDDTGAEIAGETAGKRLFGGEGDNRNLTIYANEGTGGFIQLADIMRPLPSLSGSVDLGTSTALWQNIYISGSFSDATDTFTVAQGKAAYDHSQITTGNPHGVSYDELDNQIGTLTVSGDATGSVDLSSSGAKGLTLVVSDDSHNHTVSTISDFQEGVFDELSGTILQNGGGITWTFDDPSNTITPAVSITTSNITDVAAPSANTILAANDAGDAWSAVSGTITLTGDVTGSGSYLDASGGWSIALTLAGGSINALSDVDTSANLDIGDYLIWDGTYWVPTSAGNQISHALLTDLGADDHTQYALLAGRSGGQTLIGGSDASDNLILESTSNATKGSIQFNSNLIPLVDHDPPTEPTGQDIGGSSANFKDLYMKGFLKGAKFENLGADPATNVNTTGRVIFNTTNDSLSVCKNDGTWETIGAATSGGKAYDIVFTAESTKSVNVSADIGDARYTSRELQDPTDNYAKIEVKITAPDANTVQIDSGIALTGTYRLIVTEVSS